MTEHFSFFDAVLQDDGTYEEEYEYDAQRFTNYFKTLVTTGVMKGASNMLAVSTSGSNMVTKVNKGIAFIEGRYYENDSFKDLTHDTETLGVNRIDRIVVRMDLSTEARYVKSFIKKGVPSTNPVPPTLTQTTNLYEISLAQVKIVGGQTFIATDAVTDERGKDVICPWAGSNILPNFNQDGLQELIDSQLVNGKYTKLYSGDLDLLMDTGFYHSEGALVANHAPLALASLYRPLIEVFKTADNWTVQRFSYGNSDGFFIYVRIRSLGIWLPWEEVGKKGKVSVRKTLNQSVVANKSTSVIFEYVEYDTHGFWDSENNRIRIPPGVKRVKVTGGLYYESTTSIFSAFQIIITQNGQERGKISVAPGGGSGAWFVGGVVESPILYVSSNQYIELKVYPIGGAGSVMYGYNSFLTLEVVE